MECPFPSPQLRHPAAPLRALAMPVQLPAEPDQPDLWTRTSTTRAIAGYDEAPEVSFVDKRGNRTCGLRCLECGEVVRRNMSGLHRRKHRPPPVEAKTHTERFFPHRIPWHQPVNSALVPVYVPGYPHPLGAIQVPPQHVPFNQAFHDDQRFPLRERPVQQQVPSQLPHMVWPAYGQFSYSGQANPAGDPGPDFVQVQPGNGSEMQFSGSHSGPVNEGHPMIQMHDNNNNQNNQVYRMVHQDEIMAHQNYVNAYHDAHDQVQYCEQQDMLNGQHLDFQSGNYEHQPNEDPQKFEDNQNGQFAHEESDQQDWLSEEFWRAGSDVTYHDEHKSHQTEVDFSVDKEKPGL